MMSFATLTQDGDQQGAFTLGRDPTLQESEKIRKWVGLRKRREFDEETLAAMQARGRALADSAWNEKRNRMLRLSELKCALGGQKFELRIFIDKPQDQPRARGTVHPNPFPCGPFHRYLLFA
jgi:hypothetical protein